MSVLYLHRWREVRLMYDCRYVEQPHWNAFSLTPARRAIAA